MSAIPFLHTWLVTQNLILFTQLATKFPFYFLSVTPPAPAWISEYKSTLPWNSNQELSFLWVFFFDQGCNTVIILFLLPFLYHCLMLNHLCYYIGIYKAWISSNIALFHFYQHLCFHFWLYFCFLPSFLSGLHLYTISNDVVLFFSNPENNSFINIGMNFYKLSNE